MAPSKIAAVRLKEVFDEIGHVTGEIVISPQDNNEPNEEADKETSELVCGLRARMMARHKTGGDYAGDEFLWSFIGVMVARAIGAPAAQGLP